MVNGLIELTDIVQYLSGYYDAERCGENKPIIIRAKDCNSTKILYELFFSQDRLTVLTRDLDNGRVVDDCTAEKSYGRWICKTQNDLLSRIKNYLEEGTKKQTYRNGAVEVWYAQENVKLPFDIETVRIKDEYIQAVVPELNLSLDEKMKKVREILAQELKYAVETPCYYSGQNEKKQVKGRALNKGKLKEHKTITKRFETPNYVIGVSNWGISLIHARLPKINS